MKFIHEMELIHLRILLALQKLGTLSAAAIELNLTQSALSHQIRTLEQRLHIRLWSKQGRTLVLTQSGRYLCKVAQSILPIIKTAELHMQLLAAGKTGNFKIGMECHACFEWLRIILNPFLDAWPELDVDVTSRFRFDSFNAIQQYELDAVLTSDPAFDDKLCYQPLFDFELVLIVPQDHRLAAHKHVAPEQLRQETILSYPVPRHRLDIFTKVLQPHNVEPFRHKPVEETDIMLQLVASQRGICLLPDWLLAEKNTGHHLLQRKIQGRNLKKTMFLAIRHEDRDLEYMQWFVRESSRIMSRLLA